LDSIIDKIEKRIEQHPDKLLYSFLESRGQSLGSYSYRAFWQRVSLVASHLCNGRDLRPGDRVLLVYPAGLEMICALFACVRAGLIPVPTAAPAHYGFTSAIYRMAHIARDCQAAAMLTCRECWDQLHRRLAQEKSPSIRLEAQSVGELQGIITDELVEFAGSVPNDKRCEVFLLQYTSGSTSSPKGVIVTHENVIHNCLVVDHEAPVCVSWLPQHHDMGLLGYYVYIVLSGGTTYGFSPISFIQCPSLWFETISRYSATASSAPNFAFEYCLHSEKIAETGLSGLNLSSLRFLMAAAEPIRPDTYRRFLQRFERYGLKSESFFVAYGLAENTLAVTNYGRRVISINKTMLAKGLAQTTSDVSAISSATHVISCGKPLDGNRVRIVNPETRTALPDNAIGEVWIKGPSKCSGYWNNPTLTRQVFQAQIQDDKKDQAEYLRTGDMGFIDNGELYICGRRKDMIIIRGQNFYPQDIETIVEQGSPLVRRGCTVAFEITLNEEVAIAVVAEVVNRKEIPEGRLISNAIRSLLNIEVGLIAFVASKSVPRTSSGKVMRYKTKQMWLGGDFNVLDQHKPEKASADTACSCSGGSPFAFLKERYRLTGNEQHSLVEAGVDSLDLVIFVHGLKEYFKARLETFCPDRVDLSLIQRVNISDLFHLAEFIEKAPTIALQQVRSLVDRVRELHRAEERELMLRDKAGSFTAPTPSAMPDSAPIPKAGHERPQSVLLTGGTGFLGPFLVKSLLEQTDATIYVLARATSEENARQRFRQALNNSFVLSPSLISEFDKRVLPVCGNLEKPSLDLNAESWCRLANEVDVIYHSAASVNYLFNYAVVRGANVDGTKELLKLAFEGRLKQFNYVSSTFIFGWAKKDVLYETDNNDDIELLDFGYSQSKWVAEQVVLAARRAGLPVRIFRPALITPSVNGGGNNFDIAIRLLAFMIKHGIGVDTLNQVSFVPGNVTANNIVAISNLPDTIDHTFHVVRDEYANMIDITNIINAQTGRRFQLFPLRDFVPEVIRRCTKEDILFPLLDFLIGSVDNISGMEFKRYDSLCYQQARNSSPWGVADPSLEGTVGGILSFMQKTGLL